MKEPKTVDLPYEVEDINGRSYKVSKLLFGDFLNLVSLGTKLLGIDILDIDITGKKESTMMKIAAEIIANLLRNSTSKDYELFFTLVGKTLSVDGEKGFRLLTWQKQSVYWPRRMADLPSVVGLFLRVQFADFFEGVELLTPEGEKKLDEIEETNPES